MAVDLLVFLYVSHANLRAMVDFFFFLERRTELREKEEEKGERIATACT